MRFSSFQRHLGLVSAFVLGGGILGSAACSDSTTGVEPEDGSVGDTGIPDRADSGVHDANRPDTNTPDTGSDVVTGDASDAGDASDSGPACVPTATAPCVRNVWIKKYAGDSLALNTCATIDKVDATGVLECWGTTGFPLGLDGGTYLSGSDQVPVVTVYTPQIFPLVHIKDMSMAEFHVCSVEWDAGGVQCWGLNDNNQLGISGVDYLLEPGAVATTGIEQVQTGIAFTCAMEKDAGVSCWGFKGQGFLGFPLEGDSTPVPTEIPGLVATSPLALGSSYTCTTTVSDPNGRPWCWGAYTALGNSAPQMNSPAAPDNIANASPASLVNDTVEVAINTYKIGSFGTELQSTMCLRLASGSVTCVGANYFGQLGMSPGDGTDFPVAVAGLSSADQIVGGEFFFCALSDGTVQCWGRDTLGQCGVDPTGNGVTTVGESDKAVTTPTAVNGLPTNIVHIAAGGDHACAITAEGQLWCWGGSMWLGTGDPGTGPGATLDMATPHFTATQVTSWQ